jgi:hypothetical protein
MSPPYAMIVWSPTVHLLREVLGSHVHPSWNPKFLSRLKAIGQVGRVTNGMNGMNG